MALYRDSQHLKKTSGDAFDKERKPGEKITYSGIYRCKNCGDEIAANKGDPLPPQNHHQHTVSGPVLWKLIIASEQK